MGDSFFMSWVRYHTNTEAFDRTLPGEWSGRSRNSWQPHQQREVCTVRGLRSAKSVSGKHAHNQYRKMPTAARGSLIARDRAINFVERFFTHETQASEVIEKAIMFEAYFG